jgi:SAM-dependent methyltransferase
MIPLPPAAFIERPTLGQRWFAAVYDRLLAKGERRGMAARRTAVLAEARGRTLEIGAGTGLNLEHYPAAVDELVLTEPDPAMLPRLHRRVTELARDGHEIAARTDIVAAPAGALPFPDGAFDTVVSTLVLCTAPEPAEVLAELRRVLRPDGRLLLIEHVLAPDSPRLARWQRRLNGPWAGFAQGCRCHQPTSALLADAGLDVGALRHESWDGMQPLIRPLIVGGLSWGPA